MKRKKAALYDPYLDTLGGGEKHILSILKVLEDHDFEPHIFWNTDLSHDISKTLNINFKNPIIFNKNIFALSDMVFEKIRRLHDFDIFLYVTDGSYFFSSAKQTYIFCMVPQKSLYNMSLINRLKTNNAVFIANSTFTSEWLSKWGVQSQIIHPYIDQSYIDLDVTELQKSKIILSVGRFFPQLHSKRHDVAIDFFKRLKKLHVKFSDYSLILAGGLKKEDNDYFDKLRKLAGDDPSIQFMTNISYQDLFSLYKKSQFYWHFAGYGIDEEKSPELVEHLGITPLEAMASGCITFSYQAGGPKLLIQDMHNGFLFTDYEELASKMSTVIDNPQQQESIKHDAKNFVRDTFGYEFFSRRVEEVMLK